MNKTKQLARGGILTAISVLCVYISTIIPTSKLYILGIASCIIPIAVITTGIRHSLLVYFSTSILCLLLLGLKWNVLAYIILFGSYGFIKYYIEKLNKLPIEVILKLIFFNCAVLVIYYLYTLFFFSMPKLKIPLGFAIVMLQLIFIICDNAISIFIAYINRYYLKNINN